MAYVDNFTVYGPYITQNNNRKIVIVIDPQGNRRTISYPKWLLECELERPLHPDTETVDHLNYDINDNRLENLRIVPRKEHSADDTRRVKNIKLKCPVCGKTFERSPRLIRDKSKKGKVSSFCSRECAGKYSRDVQLGLRKKLPVLKPPASEYYRRKNVMAVAEYLISKYGSLIV